MNSHRLARAVLAGAAILGLAPAARAQGLEISPVLVRLLPGQAATTLSVTNRGTVAAALQLRPFHWDQPGQPDQAAGADTLQPTAELAVSPPMSEVQPGQTQTFRLVLRRPASGRESSYRLLLDQLPPPTGGGMVRVVMRFSIPVFARADASAGQNLEWRVAAGPGGGTLVGVNRGGEHVRVIDPVLIQPDGSRLSVVTVQNPYILAGAERSWPIKGRLRGGTALRLVASSDQGPIDAVVHVAGP